MWKFYFIIIIIILFLEREEEKEKERDRNINVWLPLSHPILRTWTSTQACVLTRNQTGDPTGRRLALNPLSHTSQGNKRCLEEAHFS